MLSPASQNRSRATFENCKPSFESTSFSLIIYTTWMRRASFLGCLIEQKSLLGGGGDSRLDTGWITRVDYSCRNLLRQQHHASTDGDLPRQRPIPWLVRCKWRLCRKTAIFSHSDKGFTTNELATQWLSYFDTWTRDAADGQQCLLILDGHRTHYSLDFIRYAVQNKITRALLSYPGHTTHLLQPLDIGLFAPLQKAYGTAAHTHTRETRTGITKKLFFSFYSQAKRISCTRANIKAAWRATGIRPYNPNAILQPLLQKLEQPLVNGVGLGPERVVVEALG